MNARRRPLGRSGGYAGPAWVNVCTVPEATPPTPQGSYQTDGQKLGVSDAVAVAFAAALAAHAARGGSLPPCSNTGKILEPRSGDAPAFVDYLAFTLRGMRRVLSRVRRERPAPDGLDDLRAVLWDTAQGGWDVTAGEQRQAALLASKLDTDCTGCLPIIAITGKRLDRGLAVIARTMVESCAPALVFGELTGRGLNGYTDHLKIFTHLGQQCGSIAVGGNRETVNVILTGQACQRVDMERMADALAGCDFRIGRLDATWDDFEGRYGTPQGAATNYEHGGFRPANGPRSEKVQLIGDLGSGAGSTFYLGDRVGRLLRIYEKGKQLGDKNSPWVRYELQLMGGQFDLTLDNLRHPGALLNRYPDLGHLPVDGTGPAAQRVQAEAEISTERVVAWLATTCGAALTLLVDSIGATTVCDLVHNPKTPKRLRNLGNSRAELGGLLSDVLLSSRKYAPIARTTSYLSAEQRGISCQTNCL